MMKQRQDLIAELAAAGKPVQRVGRIGRDALIWLCAAALLAVGAVISGGPVRSGALAQLGQAPQFMFESVLGIVTIVALAVAAFRTGIPSPTPIARQVAWPLALLVAWVCVYVLGLISPALEPSMAGKRAYCWLESLAYGLPGLVLGCLALRRLWPLHGAWTGALLGLAAGSMPALIMQFACMYAPLHILEFHLLPGLALGLVGAGLGKLLLRPR